MTSEPMMCSNCGLPLTCPAETRQPAWHSDCRGHVQSAIRAAEEAARAEEREGVRDILEDVEDGLAFYETPAREGKYLAVPADELLRALEAVRRVRKFGADDEAWERSRSTTLDAKFAPCGTCLACTTSGNTACERQPKR